MSLVKLSAILNGMEMPFDETRALLDRTTGEVFSLSDEEFGAAEDGDDPEDYPEWQRESIERAKVVEADTTGRFLALPGRFDIDEWRMMRDFAFTVEDANLTDSLLNAIHGRGAFRYFEDLVHQSGLADRWYAYRNGQYRKLALEWCEAEGIDVDPNA